jgi:phage terminase small subunit
MNARAQNVVLASESLTAKQLAFARAYVECRNATLAYKMAYRVDVAGNTPEWIYNEASRQLAHPGIAMAIQELHDAAAAQTIITARQLVQDLVDMASVDPEEVTSVRTINCRHCWGADGRYQWRDEAELSQECEAKQTDVDRGVKWVKFPDALGGFGYTPQKGPNPECSKCNGTGLTQGAVTDSATWSIKARKLVKGVKQTANGIEILMNDPLAVRVELLKILGVYGKDIKLNPAEPDAPVAADATEAQAANGYLEMLG